MGAPLGSIDAALAVATEGATIALAPGRYEGRYVITVPGLSIRGTSVANTILTDTTPAPPTSGGGDQADSVIWVRAAGFTLSDVRIDGINDGVMVTEGDVTIRRLVMTGTQGLGTSAAGARMFAEDLILRHLAEGAALAAQFGSAVTARRAVIEDSLAAATVAAEAGSTLDVEDVAVIRQRGGAHTANLGFAAFAVQGGTVTATRLVAVDCDAGVVADGEGSSATVRWASVRDSRVGNAVAAGTGARVDAADLVAIGVPAGAAAVFVRGTAASALAARMVSVGARCVYSEGTVTIDAAVCRGNGTESTGLLIRGATANLRQIDVADVSYVGISVFDGAAATIEDLAIRDVAAYMGAPGYGVLVQAATVSLTRARFERVSTGFFAYDAAHAEISDIVVREGLDAPADFVAIALGADAGASLTVERALVEDVIGEGATAVRTGSVSLTDAVIRRLRGTPVRTHGIRVAAQAAPSDVHRVEVDDVEGFGLLLARSDLLVEDLTIRNVIPRTADGMYGEGLHVFAAAGDTPHLRGARVVIEDVTTAGLHVEALGESTVSLTDLRIARVRAPACPEGLTCDPSGGVGVFARGAASVALTNFVVRESDTADLLALGGGALTLSNGLVADAPTCASSDAALDRDGASDDVTYDACGAAPVTWAPSAY